MRPSAPKAPSRPSEICIVGMALRLPDANTPDAFWNNLVNGVESISHFTTEELLAEGVNPALLANRDYVRAAGVVKDFKLFAPEFFRISDREAELMDPQQRIALECAWEALEDAGCDPARYEGNIGVFAGAGFGEYRAHVLSQLDESDVTEQFVANLGQINDFFATRVSYALDLKGPSMSVQTACSTSLVAVHLACRSLEAGESDLCLAGGVSIEAIRSQGYLYHAGGIVSPDGHCRTFDASASGTVFSSGAGFVALKRLSDAVRDRDVIYAVIRGSAVNNDGRSKVGFFAPSVQGQVAVVSAALAAAHVSAADISYIEAHGTGTTLGDPIEIEALREVFSRETAATQFCAIGSVKPNIGHVNTAAGVTSLIKTALALTHRTLPPTVNFHAPNPNIDFESSPFFVNTTLRKWDAGEGPRRAGVTSLGVGGTNAHVVLEEAPVLPDGAGAGLPACLVPLSAKDPETLRRIQHELAAHLAKHPDTPVEDVALTYQTGRSHFEHRLALVSPPRALQLAELLGQLQTPVAASECSVIFVLPGSTRPHVGMARSIFDAEPMFRDEMRACSELLAGHLDLDLLDVLYADPGDVHAQSNLQQPLLSEPALFCLEYALARLLIGWNVRPSALFGYGVGEYVAAVLSGVLDLESAIGLLTVRAREMQALLSAGGLHLGDDTHHRMFLETAAGQLAGTLRGRELRQPQIPVVSSFQARWWNEAGVMQPAYWEQHLLNPPKFSRVQEELRNNFGRAHVLQFAASPWLGGMLTSGPDRDLLGGDDAYSRLLRTLGGFWMRGGSVDWAAFSARKPGRKASLPTYPFKRREIWFGANPATADSPAKPVPSASVAAAAAALPTPPTSRLREAVLRDSSLLSPDRSGRFGIPVAGVTDQLREICRQTLKAARVEETDSFLDCGGDSLRASQFIWSVEKSLGVRLELEDVLSLSMAGLAELMSDAARDARPEH